MGVTYLTVIASSCILEETVLVSINFLKVQGEAVSLQGKCKISLSLFWVNDSQVDFLTIPWISTNRSKISW